MELLEYLEGFLTQSRKDAFLKVLEKRTKFITVAVEDVYQTHNTSAVVRSCDVFGIQEAHLIESRYGKRLDDEIAMGAQKWVDIYRYKNTADCISRLSHAGYKIIATTPHDNSCLLDDFMLDQKVALFFGTERNGLSKEVMDRADGFLKIPMVGFTESLNISVSAAIILQQFRARMEKSGHVWQLTEGEKLDKRLDWSKKSIRSIEDIMLRYQEEWQKKL